MTPKELYVKKLALSVQQAAEVPAVLAKAQVVYQPIACVDWKEAYPYAPQVAFAMAYTNEALLLHYRVTEASVRAMAGRDNGPVWEDACVEFFSMPGGDDVYYNIECNCTGTLLIGAGSARSNRQHASQVILDQVSRWASLGREGFDERVGECSWEVWTGNRYGPISISVVTNCRPLIFCPGARLNCRSLISIVRLSSEHYILSKSG